jgi:hypothetical protein
MRKVEAAYNRFFFESRGSKPRLLWEAGSFPYSGRALDYKFGG